MAFNGMIFQNPSVMDVRFDGKSLINDKKEAILDGVVPKSVDGLSGGTIKGDVSVLSESANSPTLTLRMKGSSLIARITVSNEENHIEVNNNKVANIRDVDAAVGNVQTNLDNFVESTTTELTSITEETSRLSQEVGDTSAKVTTLEGRTNTIEEKINILETNVRTNTRSIETLTVDVAADKSNIASLQSSVTNIESQIGNIGTLLDNINGETI